MTSDLAEQVRNAGVVGEGGAGFPAHVKVAAKVEIVILNGAECEPLLRVDQQLMARHATEIVRAMRRVMDRTEAKKGYIALKYKYKHAIAAAREAADGRAIEVFILPDFYPAGDEFVLTYEVTGRVIRERGIPIDVGVLVHNVGTMRDIDQAARGRPVTRKHVTVTGGVRNPITVELPIGTSFADAIELAGGPIVPSPVAIDGGPLTGKVTTDLDTPIVKTTSAIVVLPSNHSYIRRRLQSFDEIVRQAKVACIQCSMCTDVCPRYFLGHSLRPHMVMRDVAYNPERTFAEVTYAQICCDCGLCDMWACPMDISPRITNMLIKDVQLKNGVKHKPEPLRGIHPLRENRKVPVGRLIYRLGMAEYNLPAPLTEVDFRPRRVVIPLQQHIGAPAVPVIQVGNRVAEGDLIADIPEGALGAKIFASMDGRVTRIEDTIRIEAE
jgi:Na+-translocating ferredoxin:NAD+ oxidoreductase RnfC subunit